MHVLLLRIEILIPGCRSLKEKRSVIRPLVDRLGRTFSVSAAEVDHTDVWQRSSVGVAVVSGSAAHAESVAGSIDRWLGEPHEFEVLEIHQWWASEE